MGQRLAAGPGRRGHLRLHPKPVHRRSTWRSAPATRPSSRPARCATGGFETRIVSIDPQPRAEVDELCDRVLRVPLEAADLSVFDELSDGDVLFFDGSHRTFMNSDATVFFLEVLPRLADGVLVGVHDVFLPYDYPRDFADRYYSEQYLLAAHLIAGNPRARARAAHVLCEPSSRAQIAYRPGLARSTARGNRAPTATPSGFAPASRSLGFETDHAKRSRFALPAASPPRALAHSDLPTAELRWRSSAVACAVWTVCPTTPQLGVNFFSAGRQNSSYD